MVAQEVKRQQVTNWEAKRDEERNREKVEQSLEKAGADKKYEDLM